MCGAKKYQKGNAAYRKDVYRHGTVLVAGRIVYGISKPTSHLDESGGIPIYSVEESAKKHLTYLDRNGDNSKNQFRSKLLKCIVIMLQIERLRKLD